MIASVVNRITWDKVASLTCELLKVDLDADDTTVILVIPEFRSPFSQTFTPITEGVLQMLKTQDPGGIRRLRPFYFRQMFSVFYPHPRSRSVSGWMFGDFLNWFLEAKQPRKVFEMEEGTLDTVNLSYTANLDNIRVSTTKTTIIDLSKRIETIRHDKLANVRPREGCLYIPLSRDGQMLDLFAICTFGQTRKPAIWLFHGTVVATHDIKVEPFSTLASW